jgi:hypothetical protein
MRLPDLGRLMQQPPNKMDALAALWFGAERAVHHRHGAVFTLGMSPEVSIGDAVAEADVHSSGHPKSMPFISLRDLRTIRNISCASDDPPRRTATAGSRRRSRPSHHEYVQIWLYGEDAKFPVR